MLDRGSACEALTTFLRGHWCNIVPSWKERFTLRPHNTLSPPNWAAWHIGEKHATTRAQPFDIDDRSGEKRRCGLPLTQAGRTERSLPQIHRCAYLLCSRCISDGLQQECDLVLTRDGVVGLLQKTKNDATFTLIFHIYASALTLSKVHRC